MIEAIYFILMIEVFMIKEIYFILMTEVLMIEDTYHWGNLLYSYDWGTYDWVFLGLKQTYFNVSMFMIEAIFMHVWKFY